MEQQNPGASPAVTQALQRRGMGAAAPQLAQASPQAPMQNPVTPPVNPSDLNKASEAPGQGPAAPAAQPKWIPQNQEDFVVSALAEQLKNINSLKKEQLKIQQPSMGAPVVAQQPQPAAPPQPGQGGGGMCPVCSGSGCNACNGTGGGGGMSNLFPLPTQQKTDAFNMGMPMPKSSQQGYSF